MSIIIKNTEKDGKGIFEAYEEDKKAGAMTYVKNQANIMIIDHTEVDPAFGGKGIGKQLVNAAVAYARAKQMKIMPLCPFANKVMTRSEEYADILA